MQQIYLHSEQYSRDGSIAADGAKRLLGQPSGLTELELVIRESIQNSWDASLDSGFNPRYSIRIRKLNTTQKEALANFYREMPPKDVDEPVYKNLNFFLSNDNPIVMEIIDKGTRGLGGPTSASESIKEGESNDFVNFVRNIGSPRDVQFGGGTYGFGKSSLFKMSKCQSIFIHTYTQEGQYLEDRVIGHSLGSAFDYQEKRYTGRHWWGLRVDPEEEAGSIDPVRGDSAKEIASSLGLTAREGASQKGTSIMILDPDLVDLESEELATDFQYQKLKARIQEILLWHAWPKFTPKEDGLLPMNCNIDVFGNNSEIKDPRRITPLYLLTDSLKKARNKSEGVSSKRPKKLIGHFGETKASQELPADQTFRTYLKEESLIPEKLCHMALLRPAELIVKYNSINLINEEAPQWGAVFICENDREVEQAFARSEPPAHDDWDPTSADVTPNQKTYVNVAKREIKKKTNELAGLGKSKIIAPDSSASSLAKLAGEIGKSLIGTGIGGSDGTKPKSSTGTSNKKKKALRLSKPSVIGTSIEKGLLISNFSTRLTGSNDKEVAIKFTPWVKSDDGKESIAPNGRSPKIKQIFIDNKIADKNDDKVLCMPTQAGVDIRVSIEIPDYVGVLLEAELIFSE